MFIAVLCRLVFQPLHAAASTGHADDEITLFGVVYASAFLLVGIVGCIVIIWLQRRDRTVRKRRRRHEGGLGRGGIRRRR
jgi:hypothetical protein